MKKVLIVVLLILVVGASVALVTNLGKTNNDGSSKNTATASKVEDFEDLTPFALGDVFYASGGVRFNKYDDKTVLSYLKGLTYTTCEDESRHFEYCNIVDCYKSNDQSSVLGLLTAVKLDEVYYLFSSTPVWVSERNSAILGNKNKGWQFENEPQQSFTHLDGGEAVVTYVEPTMNGKLFGSINANETQCEVTYNLAHCAFAFSGSKMYESQSYELHLTVEEGYQFPSLVDVSGTCDSYSYENGVLNIVHPRSDLTITAIAEPVFYTVTSTILNGSAAMNSRLSIESSVSVQIVPDDGYTYPLSVSVSVNAFTYNSDTGVVHIDAVASDVIIEAECILDSNTQISTLTAFESGDVIEAGDLYVFETSMSDADILEFCQGLTYSDGTCYLVSDSQQDGMYVGAIYQNGVYILTVGGTSGLAGWASDAIPDMGIVAGWNGLDQDGKVVVSVNTGTVGYINSVSGWNGTIIGFEKGTASNEQAPAEPQGEGEPEGEPNVQE